MIQKLLISLSVLSLVLSVACGGGSAPPAKPAKEEAPADVITHPVVEMRTSLGTIKIELYPDKAPKTVENFLGYAREGFYDGTIFHRVIPGFMIQGGGFTPDLSEKEARAAIENEAANGLKNVRGTIAMARTGDPHSATAQFFINGKDNPFLDYKESTRTGYGYAVFGKVVEGLDVVDQIEKVSTGSRNGYDDVPVDNVVIESVRVLS
jgi:cyclophilin family peptidyl-prolyl cis-trans isomerase